MLPRPVGDDSHPDAGVPADGQHPLHVLRERNPLLVFLVEVLNPQRLLPGDPDAEIVEGFQIPVRVHIVRAHPAAAPVLEHLIAVHPAPHEESLRQPVILPAEAVRDRPRVGPAEVIQRIIQIKGNRTHRNTTCTGNTEEPSPAAASSVDSVMLPYPADRLPLRLSVVRRRFRLRVFLPLPLCPTVRVQ